MGCQIFLGCELELSLIKKLGSNLEEAALDTEISLFLLLGVSSTPDFLRHYNSSWPQKEERKKEKSTS